MILFSDCFAIAPPAAQAVPNKTTSKIKNIWYIEENKPEVRDAHEYYHRRGIGIPKGP